MSVRLHATSLGETGSEQSVENEMVETWTSSGHEADSPRVTLWMRTGWEMTQNKKQHRHHPSGAQVLWGGERLLKGGGVQKRVRVEKKQEEPRENRGEGGGAVFRKGSGWKGLNWDTLRKQASKAHLKSAMRKWCRLFLNRSRFI